VINPDPDFGGVRKRIQSFISTLGRTGHRLGSKQENVLRNILQEVYYANGFRDDDNSTWIIPKGSNRKNPTLEDVLRYANYKLKGMFLGTSSRCVSTLEKLNKTQAKINNKIKFAKNNEYDKSIIEEQMAQLTIAGNGYVNRLSQMVEEVAEWKIYIDANIPKVKQFIEGQEAFNIRLVHLEASDAVNLWLVTKSEEDFTKALKAIKYSESFGNDETGNRIRIEYRKETNVFTIMKDNSTNIVVDTKPTSCDGGCNV